jgi:hypothetical protein
MFILSPSLFQCEELGAVVFVHPWDMMAAQRMRLYWSAWLVGTQVVQWGRRGEETQRYTLYRYSLTHSPARHAGRVNAGHLNDDIWKCFQSVAKAEGK